jgi:NADH-quinone oxidoreductase subunit N
MNAALLASYAADLDLLRPELVLVGFALIGVLLGAWIGDRGAGFVSFLGAAALIAAGVFALQAPADLARPALNGAIVLDPYGAFAKAVIAFTAAAALMLSAEFFARTKGEARFEFPLLIVLSVLGMFVMVSANDLITLYVGLELQSLAAYVLAAFRRDDARSSEAGLKYFVLGALSSGLLLYGASLVYGFSGSVRFDQIALAAATGGVGLVFGLVFMIAGLAFKLSAAPFHMWTPDVYEGSPTPVTAFFATAPKLAVVALFARVLYGPFAGMQDDWQSVLIVLSGITLLVGAFIALAQTNLKRLMAYSSIHNVGFALMALAVGGAAGAGAALVYMTIYLPTTLGVFAVIMALRRDGKELETVDDLAGLAGRRPWLAALLTALLFSLAGIPPLAGFFGKYVAFSAALQAGLYPIAIIAALATVISAAYYLMILSKVWFGQPGKPMPAPGPVVALTAGAATLMTFPALVLAFGALATAAAAAAAASF